MSIHRILAKLNHRHTRLFPKFSTFTWAVIITFFILTGTFVSQSLQAQETDIITQYSQTIEEGNPNLENWNSANMDNNILKTLDTLVGTKNIADSIENPGVSFVPGGVIGTTTNLIASLYTPSASGIEYLARLKDNFLSKPAYAQGVGFASLQPLLPLWRGFRNIVYILSSLIFVIMGLLIMLRVKTGPQTVISIQSTIPKIITTLILVTFSYAIAGLLIDLMNLLQGMSLAALFNVANKSFKTNLFEPKPGLTWFLEKLTNYESNSFDKLSSGDLFQTTKLISRALPGAAYGLITMIAGVTIAIIFSGTAVGPIIGIGIAIIAVIVQIIVLIHLIKFLLGLFKVYFNIILKIIFAPLEITMGAFPNSKIGFSSWLTGLIANLAVFPLSFLFLVLINLIISQIDTSHTPLWAPNILTGPVSIGYITRGIIGFSGILLLAKLPNMIPEFIFQIKPSPWGTAIGEATKPPKWAGPVIQGAGKLAWDEAGGPVLSQLGQMATGSRLLNKLKFGNKKVGLGQQVGTTLSSMGTKRTP